MAEDTERAAELLATAGVNLIAYACTTGSLIKGLGWDEELASRIQRVSGVPATTTSGAVIRAFGELQLSRIAVATPYSDELNRKEKEFFEAHGFEVVNIKGLNFRVEEMWRATPEVTYNLACEVDNAQADAVFISCTNFKSITVIEELEKRLGKPVISSNSATMWDILKRMGIRERIKGCGELLRRV